MREGGPGARSGEASPAVVVTATDLKQWAYCPRIPFYRHVLPVRAAPTYKMERGKHVQAAVEALERRRGFRAYGMRQGERRFGVWLHSERLGLSGKLDLLILTPEACYPVDFKDTEGGPRRNHRLQLTAYALLAEEAFERPAPDAFIYLVPEKRVVGLALTEADREDVRVALGEIRRMIEREELPAPTAARGRCAVCELRNYCGDVC
ncbi:MAG: CRISPR-associated protein Cas4 [Candidatus Rokubacteria bacterium]|nr:CRISPR-associated protein Cas4 [Candidatus Rokubacteria bacterium]